MKQNNEFLKHNVSLEFLKETFYYKDGFLYWNVRPKHHFETEWSWKRFNKYQANTKAGRLDEKSGYRKVSFRVNGKRFTTKEHRIIWYILNNEVPHVIDHIDRNRSNNNIDNLRNVDYYENNINRANFKGANFHKATGKWVAQAQIGKKRVHLGLYNSEWEAIQAYRNKIKEYRGIDLNRQFVYQDIENWFKVAKPNPTKQDLIVQISCVVEEEAELFEALGIEDVAQYLHKLALDIRTNNKEIKQENLPKILDAIADIKVTCIGMAKFLGFDLEGALVEVNRANYSKFENGKPLLNEHGKIMKSVNYKAPELEPFI